MTNHLSHASLRALALAGLAAAALTAAITTGTSASASTFPSCKSIGFTVLHNDSSGGVTLPAGAYAVMSPNLDCRTASSYFTTFLNKYNKAIPGWKGKVIARGWGTYIRNNSSTQFTVKWSKAIAPPQVTNCATSALKVSLGPPNGAAGTTFYALAFVNRGSTTCTLRGWPGVSAVSSTGSQIGNAASTDPSTVRTVALARGAQANASIGIVETGNFTPSDCEPVTASGLKVYPPNQKQSVTIKMSFSTCFSTATTSLRVTVVK